MERTPNANYCDPAQPIYVYNNHLYICADGVPQQVDSVLNGATVPVSKGILGSNSSGQLIQGVTPYATEWNNTGPFSGLVVSIAANTTKVWNVTFPYNLSVTNVSYRCSTADNSANLYNLGFYTAAGVLVAEIGPTAGTSFSPDNTSYRNIAFLATCNLTGGVRYYLALTGNASTAAIMGENARIVAANGLNPTAGNVTAGAVFNASMTPPADVLVAGYMPILYLHN